MANNRFTAVDDAFIRKHYKTHTLKQMSQVIGRSISRICHRMKVLDIVVPDDVKAYRRRYTTENLMEHGAKYRFQKGQESHNKGVPMPEAVRIAASRTWFAKGSVPANYRPVGSERIDTEGYVYIKTSDPNTWKLKHRVVWEQFHKKLEKGDVIKFIDGNKSNVFIENLRLTNRIGNMQDNTVHNYPEDVRKAMHSLGVIKRRINNVKRNQNKQENEQ